jgi:hypothetical protein
MLNSFGTWLKSQGRFVAAYLGIAAIVIPTWVAIYYGQSGDENAASSLKVAREQLFESPWFCRRLGLLDFDQGLVVPLGIVERGFELCRWHVAEVAM